jgi:hypothetical protein
VPINRRKSNRKKLNQQLVLYQILHLTVLKAQKALQPTTLVLLMPGRQGAQELQSSHRLFTELLLFILPSI